MIMQEVNALLCVERQEERPALPVITATGLPPQEAYLLSSRRKKKSKRNLQSL
jgi:hypothetical protein